MSHVDASSGIGDSVKAYTALFYQAKIQSGETVLILDACTVSFRSSFPFVGFIGACFGLVRNSLHFVHPKALRTIPPPGMEYLVAKKVFTCFLVFRSKKVSDEKFFFGLFFETKYHVGLAKQNEFLNKFIHFYLTDKNSSLDSKEWKIRMKLLYTAKVHLQSELF